MKGSIENVSFMSNPISCLGECVHVFLPLACLSMGGLKAVIANCEVWEDVSRSNK